MERACSKKKSGKKKSGKKKNGKKKNGERLKEVKHRFIFFLTEKFLVFFHPDFKAHILFMYNITVAGKP